MEHSEGRKEGGTEQHISIALVPPSEIRHAPWPNASLLSLFLSLSPPSSSSSPSPSPPPSFLSTRGGTSKSKLDHISTIVYVTAYLNYYNTLLPHSTATEEKDSLECNHHPPSFFLLMCVERGGRGTVRLPKPPLPPSSSLQMSLIFVFFSMAFQVY